MRVLDANDHLLVQIKDAKSKHGTKINQNEHVSSDHWVQIKPGDVVHVGLTTMNLRHEPIVLCASGLTEPSAKRLLMQRAKELDAQIKTDLDDSVTHLVMPTVRTTPKFFRAIAMGLAIVTPQWVDKASSNFISGGPLPSITGAEAEPNVPSSLPSGVHLVKPSRSLLLQDKSYYIVSHSHVDTFDKDLCLRSGAAQVIDVSLDDVQRLHRSIDVKWEYLLSGDWDSSSVDKILSAAKNPVYYASSLRTALVEVNMSKLIRVHAYPELVMVDKTSTSQTSVSTQCRWASQSQQPDSCSSRKSVHRNPSLEEVSAAIDSQDLSPESTSKLAMEPLASHNGMEPIASHNATAPVASHDGLGAYQHGAWLRNGDVPQGWRANQAGRRRENLEPELLPESAREVSGRWKDVPTVVQVGVINQPRTKQFKKQRVSSGSCASVPLMEEQPLKGCEEQGPSSPATLNDACLD